MQSAGVQLLHLDNEYYSTEHSTKGIEKMITNKLSETK